MQNSLFSPHMKAGYWSCSEKLRPAVHEVFKLIYGTDQLISTFDNFGYDPGNLETVPAPSKPAQGGAPNRQKCVRGTALMHFDQKNCEGGHHDFQVVMNMTTGSGWGTTVFAGIHRYFDTMIAEKFAPEDVLMRPMAPNGPPVNLSISANLIYGGFAALYRSLFRKPWARC